MIFTSTISSKGQIVVPKSIRDQLNIKPSDSIRIGVYKNKIWAEPVPSVDSVFGMFEAKKIIDKTSIKKAKKKALKKKFGL